MFTLLACCLTVITKATHIQTSPVIVSIILIIFIIILILLVGFLFMFHVYLIGTKQSTNEFSKRKKIVVLNQGVFFNFVHTFCRPTTPKYPKFETSPPIAQLKLLQPCVISTHRIKLEVPIKQTFSEFMQSQSQTVANFSTHDLIDSSYYTTSSPIDIDNLYIEESARPANKSSVKKALHIASKTANVSSF